MSRTGKKDIVRQYMVGKNRDDVDYESLYKLVTDEHGDWRRKNKELVIGYLRTYVSQVSTEDAGQKGAANDPGVQSENNPAMMTFRKKKDLVRHYIAKRGSPEGVNYEELYSLAISQFSDWKAESKENVMRWLRQYVYQISLDDIEIDDASSNDEEMDEVSLEESDSRRKGPKFKNDKIGKLGHDMLDGIQASIAKAISNNKDLYFSLNRFVWVRLRKYEDDNKKKVKNELIEMNGLECAECAEAFRHRKKLHLHRVDDEKVYSIDNCVMLCRYCHHDAHR